MIHILHLEDDPMDAELVQTRLAEADLDCRITRVQSRDAYEARLGQNPLDIVLADYQLPMYDGMSALRLAHECRPDIPFIFVSGVLGEETAIEALTQGATDYVLKQNLTRLAPAVQRALEEARNRQERRQAQQALEESEIKMRYILDSVDEGFIVIDREYRIILANRAFCDAVDRREEHVIGRLCHEISPHGSRPCLASGEGCPVRRTFETGTAHAAFHTHEDAAGTQYHLELKAYPMVGPSGAVTSVIETIHDVTEKRKLQEQLVQSQKMESIARLAGGVAHDFNNMLSIIIGHSELALEQVSASEPLFKNLHEIQSAGERSAALVRQLLAFARKQTVTPIVLDLNDTVTGMLNMLRPLIGEDIDLEWRPGEGLWPVKMDPSQIDQILANLCVNARDAIEGVGRITIETDRAAIDEAFCTLHPEFVPGEYVLLTVSDDGCGMDPQTLPNIFEPFFTTKEVGKGTGLGLAMVYGIVKQNKGVVKVSSEPGSGSSFKLYLPRHAAAIEVRQRRDRAVPPPGGDETILLVEDEASILSLAETMLQKLGYRVLAAATPGEALRLAQAHHAQIRLLVADVIMPEMNGRALANQVAALSPEVACLFMSGHSGDLIAQHGILDEAVYFIQKPFTMKELAVKVRQALTGV
jgi:PAS domain S-box-containing protein